MIEALTEQPLFSVTPDRGKEFSLHDEVTKALGVEFYFPLPHHPWDRGTNENTNGLLREYFPKGKDLTDISDEYLQAKVTELNHRPRKYLGYRTPAEIYFSKTLHFTGQFKIKKNDLYEDTFVDWDRYHSALELYEKAAHFGNISATKNLAIMNLRGFGSYYGGSMPNVNNYLPWLKKVLKFEAESEGDKNV